MQELTCKSKNLEAELEKTSKKLMEVTAIATDEADKCKSAKEVIKSLATQVRVFLIYGLDFVRKVSIIFHKRSLITSLYSPPLFYLKRPMSNLYGQK